MKKPFQRTNSDLVTRMDKFAASLITKAEGDKVELADALGAFGVVTKWIAVKNRVTEGDGDGADISGYKDRIASGSDNPRARLRAAQESAVTRRTHPRAADPSPTDESGGDALNRLRSRIPGTNDGGSDGDRPFAGSAHDPASLRTGLRSVGGFGDPGTEQPQSRDAVGVRVPDDNPADNPISQTRLERIN